MKLQYAAPCDECGKVMRAGSTASYFKRKDGSYGYVHEGDCPEGATGAPSQRKKRSVEERYEFRNCSRLACSYAAGVAFERKLGPAPAACPNCGSKWEGRCVQCDRESVELVEGYCSSCVVHAGEEAAA